MVAAMISYPYDHLSKSWYYCCRSDVSDGTQFRVDIMLFVVQLLLRLPQSPLHEASPRMNCTRQNWPGGWHITITVAA
jgi:hypothetical protein